MTSPHSIFPSIAYIGLFLVLTLCSGLSQASEPAIFGKVNLSVASLDDTNGQSSAVSSHSSRIGIKGSLNTHTTLKIIYRFVWQVDITDEANASNNNIKSREQYIGLKDLWGEIRAGRHDTPYKWTGKNNVEFFSDTFADWNNIIEKSHDRRADDSLLYYKDSGQLKFGIMYAAGDDAPEPGEENRGEIFSAAMNVKMANAELVLAYQDIDTVGSAAKIIFGYKFTQAKVGFVVESIDNENDTKLTNTMISAKYLLNKTNEIRLSYGQAEAVSPAIKDPGMLALGYDYILNDDALIYILLAQGNDGGLKADADLDGDSTVIAAGIVAKF